MRRLANFALGLTWLGRGRDSAVVDCIIISAVRDIAHALLLHLLELEWVATVLSLGGPGSLGGSRVGRHEDVLV